MDIVTASGSCSCMSDEDIIRKLSEIDIGYGILYRMGVGTGADLDRLLTLTVSDIRGLDFISLPVGPLQIRRTYNFPTDLREEMDAYIGDRNGPLFVLRDGSPITAASAEEILEQCGINKSFLHLLLRHYYEETGDIYYPQHILQLSTTEETVDTLK